MNANLYISFLSFCTHSLDKLCWCVSQHLSLLVGATPSFHSSCPVHSGPPCSLTLISLAGTTPQLLSWRQGSGKCPSGEQVSRAWTAYGSQGSTLLIFPCFQATFQLVTHMHILWEKISNCSIEPSVLNETNWKQQLLTTRVGKPETACLKHPGYEFWTPESWWHYLVRNGLTRDFRSTQLSPLVQKWKQYHIY